MAKLMRNRVTERDIRDWLDANGYEGGSATLEEVELFAIKRPGWEQLFRFRGRLRLKSNSDEEPAPKVPVWGVAIDDERSLGEKTRVLLCESLQQQEEQLKQLSADMLKTSRGAERSHGTFVLLGMIVLGIAVLFLIALMRQVYG